MALLVPDQLPPLPPAVTVPASAAARAARERGLAALAQRRWEAASAALEVAVKHERRWPDAYAGLGYSYMERGQPGMAFLPLREALRLAPGYGPGWRELARCYYLMRRYDRAAEAGVKATAIAPEDGEAWLFRGLAESKGPMPTAALPSLGHAIRLDPKASLPFRVRGEVLLGAGQPGPAAAALKTALRLAPRDEAARRLLGQALRAQGHGGEALGLHLLREGAAP